MRFAFFSGGKTDTFPLRHDTASDVWKLLEVWALQAQGVDKGGNGFACFVTMRPGTPETLAELNNARTKAKQEPLRLEQLSRGYRNYAHIDEVTAIGIDYDEYPDEPPDWRPESWPCDVYAHSTHNYDRYTRPGKWRVILPLKTPIPIGREPAVRRALQRVLPRGCILRAPHQPAFLPTCPAGSCVEIQLVEQTDVPGELDWTQLVDMNAPTESVYADGEAAGTILGAEFNARGLVAADRGNKLDVVCPWASEHVSGGDLGYLYVTDDGLGKYGCAHGACKGRGSPDVYELWGLGGPTPPPKDGPGVCLGSAPVRPDGAPGEADPGLNAVSTKKDTGPFPLMSAEDMGGEDEPIPWVVEGLVSVGEPTMIVGGPGSGKTSALVALALAVASGGPVWGLFPVRRPGAVVHVDYEQGKTLRRTYRAFANGLGLDARQLVADGLLRVAPLPREQILDEKLTDAHLSRIGRELVALCRGASLCIVNSLTASTNKVNENSPQIAAAFALFTRITELTGCAFVVLHHSGRAEGSTRARGSNAIDGAVQTVFEIASKKGQPYTTWTHTKDRPAGGWTEPFNLHWNNGEAQTLRAEPVPQEAEDLPGAETPERRIEKSILFVMDAGGLSGKTRILERVGGKQTLKVSVFDDMAVRGMIEHVGSRWLLAAGVVAPREQPDGVRDDTE